MKKYLCLFFTLTLAIHATFPETVEEYLNIGEQHYTEGRFQEAFSAVGEAIRLAPDHAMSYVHLGVIYYCLNDAAMALDSLFHAIELDEALAEAYFWRATVYEEKLNDLDKALIDYNTTLYLNPGNDRYRRGRAYFLYTFAGDYSLALVDYHKAVEIDPLNYKNFQSRGVFYYNMGLYEMALDDHDTAIRLNNKDANNFSNKAAALHFMGRYEEAVKNFNIALHLDANNDVAYFNRGFSYYQLGMYKEAAQDFTEVIRIDPTERDAFFTRALIYRLLAEQSDDPAEAGYYRDRAYLDEQVVSRLDGRRE